MQYGVSRFEVETLVAMSTARFEVASLVALLVYGVIAAILNGMLGISHRRATY